MKGTQNPKQSLLTIKFICVNLIFFLATRTHRF
jgi:hypothetical protein